MADVPEHTTMTLYGASGRDLITSAIATEIAKLIFIEIFGQAEFEQQVPLSVHNAGRTWVVEGNREYDYTLKSEDELVHGRIIIEIVKRNGAIVRLSRLVDLPQHPSARTEDGTRWQSKAVSGTHRKQANKSPASRGRERG